MSYLAVMRSSLFDLWRESWRSWRWWCQRSSHYARMRLQLGDSNWRARLFHNSEQLLSVNRFLPAQLLRDTVESWAVGAEQINRLLIACPYNALYFLIDNLGSFFAICARSARTTATHKGILALAVRNGTEPFAHAPAGHHLARNRGYSLQIVLGASCDALEDDLLSSAPAKHTDDLRQQVFFGVVI